MPPALPKPVIGPVTSKFGYRPPLSFHNGQDYGWLYADSVASRRVYAPIGGKVTTGRNSLIGNYVILPMGGGWRTRLTHFDSLAVRNGQTVRAGQYLGLMGNTGSQARGVHLHVDVYDPKGIRRNPAHYYSNTFVLNVPGFAGGGSTPIIDKDYDDMRLVRRNDTATPEWSLFHPSFAGPSTKERGYYVITDPDEAVDWARLLYNGANTEQSEPRDVYVRMQESARRAHTNYKRALPAPSAPAEVNVDFTPVLEAIPSAAENGQAARDAIVK